MALSQTLNLLSNQNPRGQPAAHQLRINIMRDKILDILAAAIIGLALAALALAYFDVLTK